MALLDDAPAGVGTSSTISWPVLVLCTRTSVTSPVGTTHPRRSAHGPTTAEQFPQLLVRSTRPSAMPTWAKV
nr:hypothetical protein [Pseudonocardia sp. AL041005-10]